jgi:hypothetical protein
MKTSRSKDFLNQAQEANDTRPTNQIEQLENRVDYLQQKLEEQNEDLLNLYRRIHAQDRPGESY